MQAVLDINDDVLDAARRLAEQRSTSIDAIVTELLRKGLASGAHVEHRGGFPVIVTPADARPITDEDVALAQDED